jgi:hypothetical protein
MFLAPLLSATAAMEQPALRRDRAVAAAPASATIVSRPAIASKENWARALPWQQKEITVTEKDGRKIQIRLIEHE